MHLSCKRFQFIKDSLGRVSFLSLFDVYNSVFFGCFTGSAAYVFNANVIAGTAITPRQKNVFGYWWLFLEAMLFIVIFQSETH